MKDNIILILGGDERSLYLGEYLEKRGLQVCYYAFADTDCFNSLSDAVCAAKFVVLPLPFSRDRVTLNAPLFDEKVTVSDISAVASSENVFFGGQLTKGFCEELSAREIEYYDYFTFDELAVYNAVPTAEGVLGILIDSMPITVHSMKCAVLGYGKVGKTLADTLKSLGAEVTVFSRRESDFADCFTKNYIPKKFSELKKELQQYDVLINTVPAKVLGKNELDKLNPDCKLIEIASAPFGIDFQAAKELAFDVVKANSLPGKVAPKTAGEIIGKSIIPIFEAKGLIT